MSVVWNWELKENELIRITSNYLNKVDHLKSVGIIQGFWSVNPKPLDTDGTYIEESNKKGFIQFNTYDSFRSHLLNLLSIKLNFFSCMKSKLEIGRIIEKANEETSYEGKAEKFLKLLREE